MPTARRRRTITAVALSAVVHAVVLTYVWLQRPTLPMALERPGPPEAVIPVLILPRTPPRVAGQAPAPIRLHRRPQRFTAEPPPVAPLHLPEPKAAESPPGPASSSPAPPPPLTAAVRSTLRLGPLGCANADALGLTRAEREKCDEQLAAGAKSAPYIPPGRRPDLAAAAAQKEARIRAHEAPLGQGNLPRTPPPSDYDGEPNISGSGPSALGQVTHPTSRRAAKKLQPLPP
jgi:hypothetical protein